MSTETPPPWESHGLTEDAEHLERAIRAISDGEYDTAEELLDGAWFIPTLTQEEASMLGEAKGLVGHDDEKAIELINGVLDGLFGAAQYFA